MTVWEGVLLVLLVVLYLVYTVVPTPAGANHVFLATLTVVSVILSTRRR